MRHVECVAHFYLLYSTLINAKSKRISPSRQMQRIGEGGGGVGGNAQCRFINVKHLGAAASGFEWATARAAGRRVLRKSDHNCGENMFYSPPPAPPSTATSVSSLAAAQFRVKTVCFAKLRVTKSDKMFQFECDGYIQYISQFVGASEKDYIYSRHTHIKLLLVCEFSEKALSKVLFWLTYIFIFFFSFKCDRGKWGEKKRLCILYIPLKGNFLFLETAKKKKVERCFEFLECFSPPPPQSGK